MVSSYLSHIEYGEVEEHLTRLVFAKLIIQYTHVRTVQKKYIGNIHNIQSNTQYLNTDRS